MLKLHKFLSNLFLLVELVIVDWFLLYVFYLLKYLVSYNVKFFFWVTNKNI